MFSNALIQNRKNLMMTFTKIGLEYENLSRVFETIISSIILLSTTLHCDKFSVFIQRFGCATYVFFSKIFALQFKNLNIFSYVTKSKHFNVKIRLRFILFLNVLELLFTLHALDIMW